MTYVRSPCPHISLGLPKCDPKNSACDQGTRLVPVEMVDVPGLVPDAHLGRGLGNKFLDSIREADAIIQVVDATGRTDLEGNACETFDPARETAFLQDEIALWLAEIMKRGAAKGDAKSMIGALSGLKIDERMVMGAALVCGLDISRGAPDREGIERMARIIMKKRMPVVVACNKMDVAGAKAGYEKVKTECGLPSFPCSAAFELALRKAGEKKVIHYTPGSTSFEVLGTPDEKQTAALGYMQKFISENNGSGVQGIIDYIVYQKLGCIVVYPVEDENHFANHKGAVLPDAYLVPKGTTALGLAAKVHTDLAGKFIGAIDARKRMRVGADHQLQDGDVIKIVAGR
ncbi:MAG: TGS domain-containing protein [Candidatus Micrarchaeota archaeon]|nr:TGS domain-containing protein [Candidatus Micrarchaeota archaeon]